MPATDSSTAVRIQQLKGNDSEMKNQTQSASLFAHPLLPEAREYNGIVFPLVLSPPAHLSELSTDTAAAHAYLKQHRAAIHSLLQKHSVLLFRNFAQETPQHFAKLVEDCLDLPNFPYVGGNAVRTAIVGDRVFTANESPPDKPIPFHHELAQTPRFPSRLLFFCAKPAETGGQTPVLYSPAVYNDLRDRCPGFLKKLETTGVRYSRIMTKHDRPHSAIGRGWQGTFAVETRAQVEDVLRGKGYDWKWINDGEDSMLKEISPVLTAVHVADDGRKSFFNQLFAVWGGWRDEYNDPDSCVTAGDGSPLDPDSMRAVEEVMISHQVSIPWQTGDVMYIDNMMAQHSRATFTGARRVLASLAI